VRQVQPLDDAGGSRKRKPDKRRKVREEGTTAGDGVRRLCYCPKHDPRTASGWAVSASARTTGISRRRATTSAVPLAAEAGDISKPPITEAAPLADGHPLPTSLGHSAGCSRAVEYDHALRRGHREPNAVAAAAAKRRFVRQTLYLTSRSRSDPSERPQHRALTSLQPAAEAAGDGSCCAAGKQSPGSPRSQPVQTLAQRYEEMRRSLGSRVTCGKSAIHGYGAFSKMPHAQGACAAVLAGRASISHHTSSWNCTFESLCLVSCACYGRGPRSFTQQASCVERHVRRLKLQRWPIPASPAEAAKGDVTMRRRYGDRVRRRGGPP